jgi:endonuclease/exonuclease/phosphatase family metal-dependent hydrolase/2'-5' RNA ligase
MATPFTSYDTALCVIPPAHLRRDIDRLRALYDKAYGRWPAHINIIYPFVAVERLPQAMEVIRTKLRNSPLHYGNQDLNVRLDKSDYFSHKRSSTIYITEGENDTGKRSLTQLRRDILDAFNNQQPLDDEYQPHLTIGQSEAQDTPLREYLLAKAGLLPPTKWQVEELVVLVRERTQASSKIRVWGTIQLSGDLPITIGRSVNVQSVVHCEKVLPPDERAGELSSSPEDTQSSMISNMTAAVQPGVTFQFSPTGSNWNAVQPTTPPSEERVTAGSLIVSTYNVFVDSIHPPPQDRYPILLQNLLSDSALADVLVLQEVSDSFLSYLLKHDHIRHRYPFSTHGPPDQAEIGPLASLRNIVVLSRWPFHWDWLPFEKRHKGTIVVVLDTVGNYKESTFLPLVVAGVHLTSGLTDSSLAAKQSQVKAILRHLSRNYAENQWIVAGDFNITTSSYTIDAAVKRKSISPESATTLSSLDVMISDTGLCDSWFAARFEIGKTSGSQRGGMEFEDLYEGEEGATFEPTENPLAAEGAARSYHSRPQRYDRIFVKGDSLRVTNFNMFGFLEENNDDQSQTPKDRCGSDHWGIRASLQLDPDSAAMTESPLSVAIDVKKAPPNIADVTVLKACLDEHQVFPTDEEISKRKEVFSLVKNVLQQGESRGAAENRHSLSFVVVPVGSYRLGVWNASSDIDCLCIGQISPKTFYALTVPKLRKAADLGVRILRKVKAASGIMLELEVRGIRLDLHYCAATSVVERYE